MMRIKPVAYLALVLMVVISFTTISAQRNADSREKTEKVADILAALEAAPGKVIADVGAGEGFYATRIARVVLPGGRVAAVDVDEKVLQTLRKHLESENISNVDVVLGAFDDPKLAPSTFDSLLVYNTYHEMTEHAAMRRGMFAALKPNGRIVVVEAIRDRTRSASRDAQVKDHHIALEFVIQELTETGFRVLETRPDFIPFKDQKDPGGFWLVVAQKPVSP